MIFFWPAPAAPTATPRFGSKVTGVSSFCNLFFCPYQHVLDKAGFSGPPFLSFHSFWCEQNFFCSFYTMHDDEALAFPILAVFL